MMSNNPERYNGVAIALHWVMAFAFLLMLGSGVAMEYLELDKSLTFKLYQWHKSGGILLLMAGVLRLGWKLSKHGPDISKSFAAWERVAAKLGHWALYGLMLALPLSGWLIVSSSVYGLPTIVFDWFEWPHIPGVAGDKAVHEAAEFAHLVLAILFALTIGLHAAAVVKHWLVDKENLLKRMWF